MIGLVGSVAAYYGKQEQADRIRKEADEMKRRMDLENARRLGDTTAIGNSSGVEGDSVSLTNYLGVMAAEMKRQSEWALKAAQQQADDISFASKMGLIGDFGSSMFSYGAQNNWWQQPA